MSKAGDFRFIDNQPTATDMAAEVLAGLSRSPKQISPKYFYDANGSELFEAITDLDEYYLTRTELKLFDQHLPAIAERLGDQVCLIEYGSGSSLKIRKVLEEVTPKAYVPIDISAEHLKENAWALHQDYPQLHVYPICADLTQGFDLPEETKGMTKVGFFPGSSIGNFEPVEAQAFLSVVHDTVGPGGGLIIGVDRKKDTQMLERAYNDARGVTAEFNLNLLRHLNDKLDSDFDPARFQHKAIYNPALGCIQMFLTSQADQVVRINGATVAFADQEEVHTENSYKYHPQEFLDLCARAGFQAEASWSDDQDYFSLFLLRAG